LDAIFTELDNFDIILGQPWLQAVNPDIDWSTKTIRVRKTGEAMASGDEYTVRVVVHDLGADAMAKLLRQLAYLFVIGLREVHDAVDDINTDQQSEWTTSLRDFLKEFTDIIKEPDGLQPTRECDFEINMECNEAPTKERTYRMSQVELREVQVQLQDILAKGWIRPSKSPYGAPILFVRKKDGTMRMCVDYRKLNDITRKDRTPLPRIDTMLDSLYGAHNFNTLDMYKSYTKFELKRATYIRQHSELIADCSNTPFYPLEYATPKLDFKR
jgi:hypothetical protein